VTSGQAASQTDRRSGLLIPLFSAPSSLSWGVGDIGDIESIVRWLAGGGQRVLQLLPINEMAPDLQSPYSAISAMAIDPIYVCVERVPEFAALGGESSLDRRDRESLDALRHATRIEYAAVRRLKQKALRAAFDHFVESHWCCNTDRARGLQRFLSEQAWWIEDYAVFRAIHARAAEHPWTEWPEPLQRHDPAAIDQARRELSKDILFYQYLQWNASEQWQAARDRANGLGVQLFGDLPFMVDGDSADVWSRPQQFRLDASVGVPPDEFSSTGQDWGMPVYRWESIAATDFRWLRERARRNASLFDGYRIDHVVGFYRTYGRTLNGAHPFFVPAEEAEQLRLGEQVLAVFREAGAEIIVEDLGTVPDFVRASLARLGVPGFKVLRWERLWHTPGQPYRDPAQYPAISVATSGTHDTEPLAVWWERVPEHERRSIATLPTIERVASPDLTVAPFNPIARDALLEALFASGSNLVLLPVQDVFGWRDRINEPAKVDETNWAFRLPWPVDRLSEVPEARERQDALRRWAEKYGRSAAAARPKARATT
jgi:4-alpha-glucanotransferase